MIKTAKSSPAGRTAAAKPCDFCKSAAAALFCRKDTAFFCMACDAKLHGQTKHERVLMCEVCEQAPASVTCKADAAAMCAACDRDIHSANPLACCHVRVPVVPFYNSGETVVNSTSDMSSANDFLFSFGFQFHNSINDVVPVQSQAMKNSPTELTVDHISTANMYEIDCDRCMNNNCNKINSQSHSDFSSSTDAGVLLEQNFLLDVSNLLISPVNGGGMYCKTKVNAKDREARVLRYREKRKKRRFEKKIRYASRKAYAEMRPRIKGRFTKQTEIVTFLDENRWWFMA